MACLFGTATVGATTDLTPVELHYALLVGEGSWDELAQNLPGGSTPGSGVGASGSGGGSAGAGEGAPLVRRYSLAEKGGAVETVETRAGAADRRVLPLALVRGRAGN